MTTFAGFIADLRDDPRHVNSADQWVKAFREVEILSVTDWRAVSLFKAIAWIVAQPRTVDEKLAAIVKLASLPPGPRIVSTRMVREWFDDFAP